MKTRIVVVALLASVVAGCATTKPEMTEQDYKMIALSNYAVEQCVLNKHMEMSLGAKSQVFLMDQFNSKKGDKQRLAHATSVYSKEYPAITELECTKLGLELTKMVQQREVQLQKPAPIIVEHSEPSRTVNTYCNRTGTHTFCNSY